MDSCSVVPCDRPVVYRTAGLCRLHYDRKRQHGDPAARPKYTRGWSPAEKLAHYRVTPADPDDCYGWSGHVSGLPGRYALLTIAGRQHPAHRVAYELEIGPIPGGHEVDHVCHNRDLTCPAGPCPHRLCTNPRHLRAVDKAANLQGAQIRARRLLNNPNPTCPAGHPMTGDNLYVVPTTGNRHCRTCQRSGKRRRRGLTP